MARNISIDNMTLVVNEKASNYGIPQENLERISSIMGVSVWQLLQAIEALLRTEEAMKTTTMSMEELKASIEEAQMAQKKEESTRKLYAKHEDQPWSKGYKQDIRKYERPRNRRRR